MCIGSGVLGCFRMCMDPGCAGARTDASTRSSARRTTATFAAQGTTASAPEGTRSSTGHAARAQTTTCPTTQANGRGHGLAGRRAGPIPPSGDALRVHMREARQELFRSGTLTPLRTHTLHFTLTHHNTKHNPYHTASHLHACAFSVCARKFPPRGKPWSNKLEFSLNFRLHGYYKHACN